MTLFLMHLMLSSSKRFYWTGVMILWLCRLKSTLFDRFWNLTRPPVCIMILETDFIQDFHAAIPVFCLVLRPVEKWGKKYQSEMMIIMVIKTLPGTNKTFFFTSNCNTKSWSFINRNTFLSTDGNTYIAPPEQHKINLALNWGAQLPYFSVQKVVLQVLPHF